MYFKILIVVLIGLIQVELVPAQTGIRPGYQPHRGARSLEESTERGWSFRTGIGGGSFDVYPFDQNRQKLDTIGKTWVAEGEGQSSNQKEKGRDSFGANPFDQGKQKLDPIGKSWSGGGFSG